MHNNVLGSELVIVCRIIRNLMGAMLIISTKKSYICKLKMCMPKIAIRCVTFVARIVHLLE